MRRRTYFFSAISTLVFGLTVLPRAKAGEVVSVFPTGSVKKVQQVTIRFSTDMVPMGDPRSHKDPFTVACAGKGGAKVEVPKASARWIDNRNWSYDFATPLLSGVTCKLTKTVAKDLAGQPVTALESYSFSTGGPALLGIAPNYGDVEPDQYFAVLTEGPVDVSSVEKIAYFETEITRSRMGVRIIVGDDREKVIRSAVRSDYQFRKYRELLEVKPAKPFASIRELDSFLVLAPKGRFAEGSQIALHWPKGILSVSKIPVEEPQRFNFNVIEPFTAKFTCERVNPERPCNPILDMNLGFSRMVDRKLLKDVKLLGPKGESWTPAEFDKEAGKRNSYRDGSDFLQGLTFKAPFPAQATFKIVLPPLKDELGRSLVNQSKFPLEVKTDDYTPLVKFAATFGLLERNAEPILPVSLRNVEKIIPGAKHSIYAKNFVMKASSSPTEVVKMYKAVLEKEYSYERRGSPLLTPEQGKKFDLPKPGSERDFELVGIPLKEPGLHVVEFASPKLGTELIGSGTMYVASAALVTNLAVHLKKGRESSAVWVTTLDQAKPVAGAEVSLVRADGRILTSGKTDASGIWRVGAVEYPCGYESGGRYGDECEVFAFAKSGEDISFVSSRWTRGIEDYRFNLTSEYLSPMWGPITAHAVLDRSLIQAGETLHFKTYLREYTSNGFKAFSPKRLPKRVLIVHRGSGKTFAQPFVFDVKTGTAVGEFKVPKDATLGFYEILLSVRDEKPATDGGVGEDSEGDSYDWSGKAIGNFMVAEYRLPLMSSNVKIQGVNLVQPKDVKVDLSANYLSGGPARDLKVKVRASLGHGSFSPDLPEGSDFTFFSNPIKTGIGDGEAANNQSDLSFVFNQDATLNTTGGAVATVTGIPSVQGVRSLVVEMEYRDPNGEVKTGRSETKIYPSDTIVGLKSESWFVKAGKVAVSGIVLNPAGKPVPNQAYTVEGYRSEYITHRKRLVGGFYSYDSSSKTVSIGKVCSGTTDAKGKFECTSGKLPSGSVTLQARTVDSKGRATLATVGVSVYEEGDLSWWTPSDSDRIDLLPEQTSYQPGETAKFVLRSPFPVSTVLVTVEREGVLEAFVRTVSRDNPVIDLPLKGHYAPNVYISALALRGRVGDPKPTALIDLAKPSMKLGMTQIKVGWKAHELKVTVTPEKKRYSTREKANATVKVTRADGSPLDAADSEIAIAVVDEAIALLRKNWSLDLLSAMMGQRPLAVDTSSAQNQVIGKRHFGSKAKPPGGGGGAAGPENRELFDPMLLWLPRVKLDSKGEAKIVIPLNDSMTSFRVSAVAHSGQNFFGSGSSLIESSKDLILYSGFAPVVRDGDKITNALTVRNTTAKPMQIELAIKSAQLSGALAPAKIPAFELKPSEAQVVNIPVTVPGNLTALEYEIAAKDTKGGFSDNLKIKTKVQDSVPPQVLQATLFQLDKPNAIPVQQPKDAIVGRGGLMMDTRASLMAGLAGVKSYMEDYPYSCLEQKVSKAIALEDSDRMKQVILEMPAYFDGIGLLGFFPNPLCGSPQLSRYVLTIAKANGFEIPDETRERALSGLSSWLNGSGCRAWWHAYTNSGYRDQERVLVMDVLSLYGKMDPAWFKTVTMTPNLWKTTSLVALYQMLAREPKLENRDALMKQTENILRARVNYQGSLMNLQGGFDWESGWYLFSSMDQEAIQLFGLGIDAPGWQQDIGRMARGVTARQKRGVWDTTMANAWGVTNMRLFAKKFEKEKVTGTTQILKYSLDWAKKPSGEKTLLPWPAESEKKPVTVSFAHQGTGKPWVLMQTRSAIPLLKPWDLGYSIVRKVSRVTQDGKGGGEGAAIQWKNGDIANVEIIVTAKYDHPWVVIRDPIPAGASHLGTGLDGESSIMDRAPKKRPAPGEVNHWPSEFEEKTQSHFIAYAAYLMKGTYKINYRIRLNSTGAMKLPPTRVEAMYSPETFGEAPIANWVIAP